ncbi:MAG: hypothetical protein HY077_03900 [Elusimicrobia bacterium]|nr:hypothetical protein [Elusimicrobiota bacterium]
MRKHKGAAGFIAAEKPAEQSYVVVDFPQEGEAILSPEYTLRVGASADAEKVEVSIDGADWKACRNAVGFWWFDWAGYASKAHKVSARITTKDGRTVFSDPRKFSVKLPSAGSAKKPTKISKVRKKLSKMLGDAGINIA